jgi:hypothetical protein
MRFRWDGKYSGLPKSPGDGSTFRQFVEWWTAPYPQPAVDRSGLHEVEAEDALALAAAPAADGWPNWELIDVLDLD